jgi:hypothetical protein
MLTYFFWKRFKDTVVVSLLGYVIAVDVAIVGVAVFVLCRIGG